MQEELGKKIDLTGQRFGKWTVLGDSGERGKSRKVLWKCICDCGTHRNVQTWSLTSGVSSSCGCKNKLNLIGKKFGKLTVIRLSCDDICGGTSWVCLCDCGNETTITRASLTSGNSKSCGCSKKLSLTGERFGKLVVVRQSEERDKWNKIVWECKCDCGNTTLVPTGSLRGNNTTSCGCIRKENLIGKKFGKLKVISKTDELNDGKYVWECKCNCGNISYVNSASLKSGNTKSCGCSRAVDLTGRKFGKLTPLEITDERRHGAPVWKCECECGLIHMCTAAALVAGNIRSCGCLRKTCMPSGENHPNYNPNLTPEERMKGRYQLHGISVRTWSKKVLDRDDYTCQGCNQFGGNLNAHHLNAWNAFPEQRFDTANGITLCKDCHREFHNFNGYGDNTLEEFRDHIACTVGEEHVSEIEEVLLSRESEIIGQEVVEQPTHELQTT